MFDQTFRQGKEMVSVCAAASRAKGDKMRDFDSGDFTATHIVWPT